MTAPAAARKSAVDDGLLAALNAVAGDRVSTAKAVLDQHGHDESYHETLPPDAVVFARSTEEVAAVVKACAARKVPIVPFGTGTSLEGHVGAVGGGGRELDPAPPLRRAAAARDQIVVASVALA